MTLFIEQHASLSKSSVQPGEPVEGMPTQTALPLEMRRTRPAGLSKEPQMMLAGCQEGVARHGGRDRA
jgi:hypothetical protein